MNIFAIAFMVGAVVSSSSSILSKKGSLPTLSEASSILSEQIPDRRLEGGAAESKLEVSPTLIQGLVDPLIQPDEWESALEEDKVVISKKTEDSQMKILEISIVENSPGKKAIEMSNIDGQKFPAFKNNHALYSHGISREDTEDKIKNFIDAKLKEFKKSVALSTSRSVKSICEDMKSLASSGFGHEVTLNQPKDHFCVIEVKRSASDKNFAFNPIVCHIRVHNINDEMAGINVVQIDREYEARIPKHNYDENVAEVKNVIKMILGQNESLPISIQKAVNEFSNVFAPYCGGKKPELVNLIQEGEIYGATIDSQLACEFAGAKIFIEQFNYGYLQYLHVVIDHKLLRAEYMVGIDPKVFSQNLKIVLKELDSEIKEILKLQKDSSKEDYKITLEDIKAALTEAMPGYEVTINAEAISVKKGELEVCNSVKSKTEPNFSINFITPGKAKADVTTNPTLIITEENGFDQLERLKAHAKKFVADIDTTKPL